ncbi:DUF1285 domain-containing protein [Flexibacterium corallicola]|uniref:DUF1285 domain-containing protein n=1 Tax=Flexibacterium corallicola TaxID=3037259 RepID=UPI00386211FB
MPAGLKALMERAGDQRGLPPIDKWDPPFCGDLDMQIKRNGNWFYMGTPISREALVKLFASVLKREEDGKYYLVTPVEKIGLQVEDAPFLAVEMDWSEKLGSSVLTLRTNTGDVVEVGPDNPLRFEREETTHGFKPYVRVRGRLDALLSRPVIFELSDHLVEQDVDGEPYLGVCSHGQFFPAEPLSSLG